MNFLTPKWLTIRGSLCILAICATSFTYAGHELKNKIYKESYIDFNKNGKMDTYEDPNASIDDRVSNLLSQMTMEEKTYQLMTIEGSNNVDPKNLQCKHGVGSISNCLNYFAFQNKSMSSLTWTPTEHLHSINKVQKYFIEKTRLGIPVEFTNDEINGLAHGLSTKLPSQHVLSATFNKNLSYRIGQILGREAKLLGYHNILSPNSVKGEDSLKLQEAAPLLINEIETQLEKGIYSKGVLRSQSISKENRNSSILNNTTASINKTLQAIASGSTLYPKNIGTRDCIHHVRTLISKGHLEKSIVNERVASVLKIKFEEGLFDKPYCDLFMEASQEVANDIFKKSSYKTHLESIVLLKNKNNLLPIELDKYSNLLITGPNANVINKRGSQYQTSGIIQKSIFGAIKENANKKTKISYCKGCNLNTENDSANDKELLNESILMAKESDLIVVVVGDNEKTELSNNLPKNQAELLKSLYATEKPVVVILLSEHPIELNWINEQTPTIISGWSLGTYGGNAIADVLLGNYNPSGKLPFSFPSEDHQNAEMPPIYPFGHGISYTTFKYQNLQVLESNSSFDEIAQVSFVLTNTGKIAGEEVVQLYLNAAQSTELSSAKRLTGFEKIHLLPGETRTIKLSIPKKAVKFLTEHDKPKSDKISTQVLVGSSSRDIQLYKEINLNELSL